MQFRSCHLKLCKPLLGCFPLLLSRPFAPFSLQGKQNFVTGCIASKLTKLGPEFEEKSENSHLHGETGRRLVPGTASTQGLP